MKYLNKKMVIVLNRLAIELTEGIAATTTNLRVGQNLGFVDQIYYNSSYGMPLYPDIFHQAAAYMFYIIKNHTFHDGNKRTGLAAAITFLSLNDIQFAPFDEATVYDFVIAVASGPNDSELAIPNIAAWLKAMSLY